MCTQQDAMAILAQAYDLCQKLYGNRVSEAYLYGSYARGDYHDESDIDILLSVDLDDARLLRHQSALSHINSRLSLEHNITVSINAEPKGRFERFSGSLPYYRNVKKEGIRYAEN